MTPASKRGSETRDRIVTAALETVRAEGFANTTARAIAAHGGFNQACRSRAGCTPRTSSRARRRRSRR